MNDSLVAFNVLLLITMAPSKTKGIFTEAHIRHTTMTYRNRLPSGFWFVNFQIGTRQKPQDTTYQKIISGLLQNHAKLSIALHILLCKKWIKLFYGSLHRYFPTVECKLRSLNDYQVTLIQTLLIRHIP